MRKIRIGGLDYSTLERVNARFVSDEFARRECDIIWKVSFHGQPLYLFILIEFQSSVDRHMPIRFLRYLAEFYQSFATEHGVGAALPHSQRSLCGVLRGEHRPRAARRDNR